MLRIHMCTVHVLAGVPVCAVLGTAVTRGAAGDTCEQAVQCSVHDGLGWCKLQHCRRVQAVGHAL